MLSSDDAALLVEPLIAGLAEDPPWATFLARLRVRLGADYASLVFRPLPFGTPEARVVHLWDGRRSPDIVTQLYRDRLYRDDPMPYHDMAEGRVHALPDLLSVDDPDHQAYRARLLTPSGMNMLRMMRVTEPAGISGWLSVSRQEGDFDPPADALIADLAPFLRAALSAHVALERERTDALVAGEAIRRMAFGWLTLDNDGRILDTDPFGARLLVGDGVLRRGRDDRLAARDPSVAAVIADTIASLARRSRRAPRAIVLQREPWVDMLLVPSPAPVGTTTRPAPTLIAYVHADRWSSADRCDQLCELFDLLPSEARLALALSRGMDIVEAAGALGLTVESARTYSKRIYAKTGARGRADLVRFIHRSILSIA